MKKSKAAAEEQDVDVDEGDDDDDGDDCNMIRHGYGVQVWLDGAKYQGYWKDNKACG